MRDNIFYNIFWTAADIRLNSKFWRGEKCPQIAIVRSRHILDEAHFAFDHHRITALSSTKILASKNLLLVEAQSTLQEKCVSCVALRFITTKQNDICKRSKDITKNVIARFGRCTSNSACDCYAWCDVTRNVRRSWERIDNSVFIDSKRNIISLNRIWRFIRVFGPMYATKGHERTERSSHSQ